MPTEGQQLTSKIAVTLTAEPIFGRALALAECAAALGRMSLESVVGRLVLLKHINERVICYGDTPVEQRRAQSLRTLDLLLDPPRVQRALADVGDDSTFLPVSDQALLATLELAVCCCPREDTHRINGDPLRLELTHILFSFQSVLFSTHFRNHIEHVRSLDALGLDVLAEFVRNTMAHTTGLYLRNAIGRLYALCCVPEITATVLARTHKSATDWFMKTFGLTPEDYFCCAFLSGAPAFRLDCNTPDAGTLFFREDTFWSKINEPERVKVRRFLSLATKTVGAPSGQPTGTLDEFLFTALTFYVYPVLDLGRTSICVSPNLMMKKFIVGLPYLAQEARQRDLARPLTGDERKECRAPFGHLLESYAFWLLTKILASASRTEILSNVTYDPAGECDIVIIRGGFAVVIEVKTTMALLKLRRTGSFESLDAMLESGAKQAYRAAHAIRDGIAFRGDGSAIEGIRWVVPCVLTYDDIPLFEPISEFYEHHLEGKTGLPLFRSADGVEPVQFFDIGFVESWESKLDLSPSSGAVFGYLIQRARCADLRYKDIRAGIVAPPTSSAPKPFNAVVEEAKVFVQRTRSWIKPAT